MTSATKAIWRKARSFQTGAFRSCANLGERGHEEAPVVCGDGRLAHRAQLWAMLQSLTTSSAQLQCGQLVGTEVLLEGKGLKQPEATSRRQEQNSPCHRAAPPTLPLATPGRGAASPTGPVI